ncbi:protoporphyrinogen/coproporphyrinogen oxidase [Micromonospora tarensis]|uniref:FAD-dependent oxidoreductase n=1 Tax=Micromonospora tarensis TaxID=2806100 RepID=A0ABS1YNG1_9ACTN|nr:NAD(P)/FAD-dependent oxidoreductase [Micromonospora tarensis]MBM0278975.1 FAD-dependent oxidoreductase [Micromonospora tarensis]
MSDTKVLVVGGGPAGAAAAYRLTEKGFAVTLLERADRLGGRIRSERADDSHYEAGAHFFTNFYPRTLKLIDEVGLSGKKAELANEVFIVRDGRPHDLRSVRTAIGAQLLSPGAKGRLVAETLRMLRHWRQLDPGDIVQAAVLDRGSVAELFRQGPGRELLDYVFQPALNSFLYWSPERTSAAVVPVLIKAAMMLRGMYTLRDGYSELVERAAGRAEVLLGRDVVSISGGPGGCVVRARDRGGAVTEFEADGVVCAIPATGVGKLFGDELGDRRAFLDQVRYSSSVSAILGVRNDGSARNSAVLYPSREEGVLAAMTTTSMRGEQPLSTSVIKVHAGGPVARRLSAQTDDVVASELQRAAGVTVGPGQLRFCQVFRWSEALPEFDPGYFLRLREFERHTTMDGRVVFAGDYLGGPFVEGAIGSAERAVDRLAAQLTARPN